MYAFDSVGEYRIAKQTSGITFPDPSFVAGTFTQKMGVSAATAAGGTTEIQKWTKYKVDLTLNHAVPQSSKIAIVFPSSIKLTGPGSCTVESPSGISSSAGCAVDSSNTVTLTNPFSSSSGAAAGAALSFIFSTGGTNPQSAKDAGSFIATTYYYQGSTNYVIDTATFTDVYTPTPSVLTAVVSGVTVAGVTNY